MTPPLGIIRPLFATWKDYLPEWLNGQLVLGVPVSDWVGLLGLAVVAVLVGFLGQRFLLRGMKVVTNKTKFDWDDKLTELIPGLLAVVLGLITFGVIAPLLEPSPNAADGVEVVVYSFTIVALTMLALRMVTLGGLLLERHLTKEVADDSRKRAVRTQVAVPRGILRVLLIVIGAALILVQFEVVRNLGIGLLASAGVAGVVIGLAAQKAVGNLLAGVQLAIFQPVRIGDAVVVEGEWGWIEEIGLTHVVVKIWDLRRLVLPLTYFLDKPFQNWTRGSSDLLGTVFVYTDFTVTVDAIRERLAEILSETPLWDRVAHGAQVTDLTRDGVEVRVLMSAADGGKLWDLRCHVRERLLAWLRDAGRLHLPVERVVLERVVSEDRQVREQTPSDRTASH